MPPQTRKSPKPDLNAAKVRMNPSSGGGGTIHSMLAGLATLIWTAPGALAGLAAVILPIAAHLWSRRMGPPAVFPSIRLVLAADRRVTRRRQWRDRLLLLIRCLVVAMIVLAAARPQWRTREAQAAAAADAKGTHHVLILDASTSMQRAERGRSLFDRARDQAVDVLRKLDADARATIILADAQPHPLWPEPTDRLDALAHALSKVEPGYGHAQLNRALAMVDQRAVVHWFTDGQATAASDIDRPVTEHRVGEAAPTANLALAAPRLDPPRPIVGHAAAFAFDVVNHAGQPATVTLQLAGPFGAVARQVDLAPRGRTTVTQAIRFNNTSPAALSARLPDDAFNLDNTLSVVALPRRPWRVAVIGPDVVALSRAVEPGQASPYRVVNDRGSADFVVTTSDVTPGFARNLLHIGPLADDVLLEGTASLTTHDASRPPWRVFEGEALATLLNLTFTTRYALRVEENATMLATWPEGDAAIAARTIHGRHTIQLGAAINDRIVHSPAFVPLVHELLAMLQPQAAPPTTVGTPASLPLPRDADPDRLRVLDPRGNPVDATFITDNTGTRVTLDRAGLPGVYIVVDANDAPTAATTALIDRRESDLRRGPTLAGPPSPSQATALTEPKTHVTYTQRLLWPWCIAAAIGLLAAESLLAGRMSVEHDPAVTSADELDLTRQPEATS